jgi:haloalkane dehalogenase
MKKYPVVILHGWNLSGKTFQPLVEILTQNGFRVYAPDLPGFGENSKLERELKLDDYLKFLDDYLNKKGINEFVAICHSFGGRLGIKYASFNKKRVKVLILSGVPGFIPVRRIKIAVFFLLSKIGNLIFKLPLLSQIKNNAREFLYKAASAPDYYRATGFLKETFKNVIREDLEKPMRNLSIPVLLIWGENDKTVPKYIAYKMKRCITGSQLKVIQNENHRVPYYAPAKFFDAFHKFYQEI